MALPTHMCDAVIVNFVVEEAMKTQTGSRVITLIFLKPRR